MNLGFLRRRRRAKPLARCNVTSINIKYMGETHAMEGANTNDGVLKIKIPFNNIPSSDFVSEHFIGQSIKIDMVKVRQPFALIVVEPKLPCSIPYNSSTTFEISVVAPKMAYTGPMNLEFIRGKEEFVHVSIPKITLLHIERSTDIEESEIIANMQRNQIFKISVQLYRIMKYGEKVNRIEANKPFEVVSSDPKYPFSLDRKDSFIIELYIKAPAFSYSGALDLTFS